MTKITDQLYPRAFLGKKLSRPYYPEGWCTIWTVFVPGGLAYPSGGILWPEIQWSSGGETEADLIEAGFEEIQRTHPLWDSVARGSATIRSQQQALGLYRRPYDENY